MNCGCHLPAAYLTVRQSNSPNFGKNFFACANRACGFFQFADEPLQLSGYKAGSSSSSGSSGFNQHSKQPPGNFNNKNVNAIKLYLEDFDESSCRFWFAIYPTNPDITKIIQSQPSDMYKYNNGLKLWFLDFAIYEAFVCLLNTPPNNYTIEEIPKFIVKGIKNFLRSTPEFFVDPVINISQTLAESLLPFQVQGIKFVIRRNGRALIGDEMGCGKVSNLYMGFTLYFTP